jgi:hypothetical protein
MPGGLRRPTRFVSPLPPRAFKTFQVTSPVETHTRQAGCAEADCPNLAAGFKVTVDERTDLGMSQAAYMRHDGVPEHLPASYTARGQRRYTETHEGPLTVFTYPAGTDCFATHRVALGRPELYLVRGGDWRRDPAQPVRRHTRPEHWVEDIATQLDRLHSQ